MLVVRQPSGSLETDDLILFLAFHGKADGGLLTVGSSSSWQRLSGVCSKLVNQLSRVIC